MDNGDLAIGARPDGDERLPGVSHYRSAVDLPDGFAPLIRNAWYVVAERKDVGRTLSGLRVLGEPLVMYRTQAGEPVVLDDRCAHRRFPLSESRLVGDTIQCGYHGFIYDQSGSCTWAPGLPVKPKFGVRRYPVAEVGPWLWVWMGEADRADPATVPYPHLDPGETWRVATGYKHNPGNYLLLIENFLDLTHLHFLHGAAVSDLTQASTPPRSLTLPENSVGWFKDSRKTKVGLFGAIVGGDPEKVVSWTSTDTQIGPSMNFGETAFRTLEGEDDPLYPIRFNVTHAITPADEDNTHQFFECAFNVDLIQGVEQFRDFSRDHVFEQDVTAIRHMQKAISEDRRAGLVEHGVPSDRFGMSMRRILRKMKQAES